MCAQTVATVNQEQIRRILPHQPPFVFIDEVVDMVPGESAKATKFIDPEDPIFKLHFPGNPIYPGIYLIEGAGQLAFVTFCYRSSDAGDEQADYSKEGYLGAVRSFKFKNMVTPGMTILIEINVIARLGAAVKVAAKITCEEKLIAVGELNFTVAERVDNANQS